MFLKRNLPILSYLPAYKVFPEPVIYVPIRHSYLRAYKAPFYVRFCTFCASLRPKRTVFTRPKTCLPHEIAQRYLFGVISVSKNQRNLCPRYLRLINDLRSTKVYVRKNNLFMQNEPKFRKVKFNVNKVLTTDYDQMDTWSIGKNEPKTNPNEPKTNPNEPNFSPKNDPTNPNEPKTNPISYDPCPLFK
jgi:hypothetical protein